MAQGDNVNDILLKRFDFSVVNVNGGRSQSLQQTCEAPMMYLSKKQINGGKKCLLEGRRSTRNKLRTAIGQ